MVIVGEQQDFLKFIIPPTNDSPYHRFGSDPKQPVKTDPALVQLTRSATNNAVKQLYDVKILYNLAQAREL